MVGVATTVAPVAALSPVEGDQLYVLAPLAVSVAPVPLHTAVLEGDTLTVGTAFTVTVLVVVPVQDAALVPVMV